MQPQSAVVGQGNQTLYCLIVRTSAVIHFVPQLLSRSRQQSQTPDDEHLRRSSTNGSHYTIDRYCQCKRTVEEFEHNSLPIDHNDHRDDGGSKIIHSQLSSDNFQRKLYSYYIGSYPHFSPKAMLVSPPSYNYQYHQPVSFN